MTTDELRALDREVAEKVMGDRWVPDCPDYPNGPGWWISPGGHKCSTADGGPANYSTDIAAAWRVLEHMKALGWLLHVNAASDGFVVNGGGYDLPESGEWGGAMLTNRFMQAPGDTAPEAICAMALAVVARYPESA